MATVFKHIATGELPSTLGELFAHPGDGSLIILTSIIVMNESANPDQNVRLYVDRGGGDQLFFRTMLEEQYTRGEWHGQLVLNSGDSISGLTTDATSVNYFMDGYQVEAS